MNNPRQHRSWILGLRGRAAGAALALAIMLVPAVLATGSAQAQTFTTLYSFCSQYNCTDGEAPYARLVQGTDGNFYGTTLGGTLGVGANEHGTVFKITPSGTLTTLYSFCSQSGCTDGETPYAGLVQATDGSFYGTTQLGGANGAGTIFKITPSGTLTTLHSFCSQSCTDGAAPYAGLVQGTDGNFYGTTFGGAGNATNGTVFKITPSGTLTTLYDFCNQSVCPDGANPYAGLVQATDGNFYGTTFFGGANGVGTVFTITPSGTLTTLHSFCSQSGCTDGANPYAALVQGTDGNFYGTTYYSGANGVGTVFKITPSGTLTTLHSFCPPSGCTDGALPYAGLVQATDGNFYGTTLGGGANNQFGTVFKITPSGTLTTLYTFCSQSNCTDGAYPYAGLVQATNGDFYGTTGAGGNSYLSTCPGCGGGEIFSLSVGLAQSYSAATAFEQGWTTQSNPNGVWSYGYSSGFTGPVTLYDQTLQNGVNGPNAQYWVSSSVDIGTSPAAEFNDGPAYDDGNVDFLANEFVLVAGIGGQYSDLVFTAPAASQYSVGGSFRGDQYGVGTVVGIVANGSVIFSSSVTSEGQIVPFQATVTLNSGNTVVFSVGPGGGLQNTGLSATITTGATQETLTLTELGLGAGTVKDNSLPTRLINCSEANGIETGTCSASYASGTTVILTASPNSPSTFGGWGGACASFGTSTTCSLTMNSAQNVTADFVAPPIVVPLTLTPGTNVTGTATFCPNNPNPITPSNPCTDRNGHEFSILIPVVNSGFTLYVTATEVDPNGLCPAGGNGQSSDFDCRFVSFFNYGTDPNGNIIVPLCYPYSNGNCMHYNLSLTGAPGGGEPPQSSYSGGVYWRIAFNNDTFIPPGPYWTGSTPRLLDDPDVDEFPPPVGPLPYGTSCTTAMQVGTPPEQYSPTIYCQFDADITTFFNPSEGVDSTIGGKTNQANDVVVAFLPTSTGSDPVQTLPKPVAPAITGSCVNGCVSSGSSITFSQGLGETFAVTATGFPTPTLTESGALPSGLTFNATTGLISGTPAVGSGGNYPITLTAANGVLPNAVASFTLTVSFLEISPTSVNFGTLHLWEPAAQFVTLTNDGPTSITISSARITAPGNALGEFGDITFCDPLFWTMPGTLPAGKSCKIAVGLWAFMKIFSPTASTATLTITDSAAGSPQPVPLTALVIDPEAKLSTDFLNFGREREYNTSAAKTVTLTNTGATPLSLTSIAISGNFALSSGTTCASGGMVNPSASCILNVTFTPESKGRFIGQVTITDNAFFSPQVITLAGTGG